MKRYRPISGLLAVLLLLSALALPALALEDPDPRCGAAIVVDGDHDQVLYDKNAYERMYPASITKIMTSLLVLEAVERGDFSLDTQVTASESAIAAITADSSTAGIRPGEILTVEQLLYCDLVASANEACNILAELVGGTIEGFAVLMNQRAAELGMEDSHFVNPHGLHDPNHYTTAYDIYLMAQAAMEHEKFREIVSTGTYVLPATNLSEERTLYSTNALIDNWRADGYLYPYAVGIKTGYTSAAGRCLAAAAVDRDGRTFYCVVLGAENVADPETGEVTYYAFQETKRLLQWAFQSFERVTLMDETMFIQEVTVTLSDTDHVLVQPVGSLEHTMPADFDPADAELVVDLPESVEAPVAAGTVLGTLTVIWEGEEMGTLELVAASGVERSDAKYYAQEVGNFLSQPWVRWAIAGAVLLLIVLIVWLGVLRPRRQRYRRYSYSSRGRSRGRRY